MADYIPKWHRELDIFTKIKPLIIIEGGVLDVYSYPVSGSISEGAILRLTEYLHYYLKDKGYTNIAFFDSISGFSNGMENGYIENFAAVTGRETENGFIEAEFKGKNSAPDIIKTALVQKEQPTAVIINLASRCIPSPDNLDQNEVDSFTALLLATGESRDVKVDKGVLKNILIMTVNKVNDIPAWFYLNNPNVKVITLSAPSREERERLVKGVNFSAFFTGDIYAEDMVYYKEHTDELEKLQSRFAALTEGFGYTEINCLRRLCKNEKIRIKDICKVVDLYKYGITENPWNKLSEGRLEKAEEHFRERVKGQDGAIIKTLDVVKRAVTGMAGLNHSSNTKPKGVLFFAGPTGTGKTETAKTLAELLFGDESRCIRFDMSEYGQSHSDQRLLGAPPGYVGYEAGGQLTNAVRDNPFSILLFDEIEKAHPSILDKFLQILEDGRMTDGRGNTVYFSEAVIIFTSNLGIYKKNSFGEREENISIDSEYSDVRKKVRAAIEDYFKLELGRPEILNRIGENIVVFDFIRTDTAKLILQAQLRKIVKNLISEKNIELRFSESAFRTLLDESLANLSNGARGIGNIVESLLINPLSRHLFDNKISGDKRIVIKRIYPQSLPVIIECEE